jgi:Fe2+ or Zn2+ uptake regulation protein
VDEKTLSKRGVLMTKREEEVIEKIADEAEVLLATDYVKKDLKEKRSINKQTLYDGSKKLKHKIPKGKRV